MSNKFFLSALALAVLTPAVVLPYSVEANTIAFKDIQTLDQETITKINKLTQMNIISGYTDNTFRPNENVTRGQFALFISRALSLPSPKKPNTFKDVSVKVSTYDGIIKSLEAGIIQGYTDNTFRPNELITRAQMAIMLEKALQYKSTFKLKTEDLPYVDKNSIGKSAEESVKRLHYYGIMTQHKGKSFSPETKGNRVDTVMSIYNLLKTKMLIENETVVKPVEPSIPNPNDPKPPVKKDAREYTFNEIQQIIGRQDVLIERSGNGSIATTDMVQDYYRLLMSDGFTGYYQKPDSYYKSKLELLNTVHSIYWNAFPSYELIAVNGVPYRYSEYYPEHLKNPVYSDEFELDSLVAKPPTEEGKFLIDIGSLNNDVVTYESTNLQIGNTSSKPIKTTSNDFLVDIKGVFHGVDMVKVSEDGLTISYQDKTLKLLVGSNIAKLNGENVKLDDAVQLLGGRVFAPVQNVSRQIGLHSRKLDQRRKNAKIEVANYELPVHDLNGGDYTGFGWER